MASGNDDTGNNVAPMVRTNYGYGNPLRWRRRLWHWSRYELARNTDVRGDGPEKTQTFQRPDVVTPTCRHGRRCARAKTLESIILTSALIPQHQFSSFPACSVGLCRMSTESSPVHYFILYNIISIQITGTI